MSRKKNKHQDEVNPNGESPTDAAENAGVPPAENAAAAEQSEDAQACPSPAEERDALRGELAEANDRYVRARAEIDNYRKRTQREFADLRASTKAATVEEFLTVFDHFQMAMQHAESSGDMATLKQGMDLILKEFERAFQNLGVAQIRAEGQAFDPAIHHAVAEEASDDAPAGNVLRQWKPGYRLGERLIRPASVVVSKGPAAPDDAGDHSEQTNQ